MDLPKTVKKPINQGESSSVVKVGTIYGRSLLRRNIQPSGQCKHQISVPRSESPVQSTHLYVTRNSQILQEKEDAVLQISQLQTGNDEPSGPLSSHSSKNVKQTPEKCKQQKSLVTGQKPTPNSGDISEKEGDNIQMVNQSPESSATQLCLKFLKATQPDGKPGLTAILQKAEANLKDAQTQLKHQQQQIPPQSNPSHVDPQLNPDHAASVIKLTEAISHQCSSSSLVVPQKSNVHGSPNEIEHDVNALLADTGDEMAHEPRIGIWSSKSRKSLIARKQLRKKVPKEMSKQSVESSSDKSASAEHLLEALTTLLSKKKSQTQMLRQPGSRPTLDNQAETPYQLPPDIDRLGLSGKQKSKKKRPPKKQQTVKERESREWADMVRNIDVFMFPVYRCKLCPNYYSTVKKTISDHMKQIHNWTKVGDADLAPDEDMITENLQDKVKDIQKTFEGRLRNQLEGDNTLVLEFERQNDILGIPFSIINTNKTADNQLQTIGDYSSSSEACNDSGGHEQVEDSDDDVGDDQDNVGKKGNKATVKKCSMTQLKGTCHLKPHIHDKSGKVSAKRRKQQKGNQILLSDVLNEHGSHKDLSTSATNVLKGSNPVTTENSNQSDIGAKNNIEEDVVYEEKDLNEVKPMSVRLPPRKVIDKKNKIERKTAKRANCFKKGRSNLSHSIKLGNVTDIPSTVNKAQQPETICYESRTSVHDNNKSKELISPGFTDSNPDKETSSVPSTDKIGKHTVCDSGATFNSKPLKKRPMTRSMSRSTEETHTDGTKAPTKPGVDQHNTDHTSLNKWIRLSRYETWKMVGLDPKSKPPWPCTHLGCDFKTSNLSNIILHHRFKHDTFGDLQQRKLALALGERYSLYEGREKRAVDRANSADDNDNTRVSVGTVQSQRKKKPVKRLSAEHEKKKLTHSSRLCRKKITAKKTVRCPHCQKWTANSHGLNIHMYFAHGNKLRKNNDCISKTNCKNKDQDDDSVNISMVADEIGEEIDFKCKHCSYKATKISSLRRHLDQKHPKYVRSRYSDTESEKEEESCDIVGEAKPIATAPLSRPVRNCRRKTLHKMLAKEKKMDKVIPFVAKEIPERDPEESDQEDTNYRSDSALQCPECSFVSISSTGFVGHMKKLHNKDIVVQYQCDRCEFVATSGMELFAHRRTIHVETIICEVCGKSLRGVRRYTMHKKFVCGKEKDKKSNTKPQNVKRSCSICYKLCNTQAGYYYHMRGHRTDQTFKCDICKMTFTLKSKLTYHKLVSHTECRYKCGHCPFKAHFKYRYNAHLYDKHNIGGEDRPVLKCQFEGCTFATKLWNAMKSHRSKHLKRFKYWCDGCDQPVKSLKTLARHKVLHRDGITKYKCDICGYQATNSNTRRLHKIYNHTPAHQQKCVVCDLCGASFKHATLLKTHHQRQHSKVNTVKCKACEITFKYNYQMLKHYKTVHPDQAEAEEKEKIHEAEKILNAPPKVRKKTTKARMPSVKKKRPPTGKPRGRPPVPVTPEVVARRNELRRLRNKRKYENRKAKMARLGLKRKRYKKKKGPKTDTSNQKQIREDNCAALQDSNQNIASASQQLEIIVQAFASDMRQQEQQLLDPLAGQAVNNAVVLPIEIVHGSDIDSVHNAQLQEYRAEEAQLVEGEHVVTTSSCTFDSTQLPAVTSQEVAEIAVSDRQIIADPLTSYLTTVIEEEEQADMSGMLYEAGQPEEDGAPPPVGYQEVTVTTIRADGSSQVEMYRV